MRPIGKRETGVTAQAVELARESDETLIAMLSPVRNPALSFARVDRKTREAIRRVLRVRGYTFCKQTGRVLSVPVAR